MTTSITDRSVRAAQARVDAGKTASVTLRDQRVGGLSLSIGRRSCRWHLDYKLPDPGGGWSGGKRLVLGDLATMDHDAARAAAEQAKAAIAEGIDPGVAKRARRAANVAAGGTVGDAIERFTAERRGEWTASTAASFAMDFGVIRRALGDLPMALVARSALQGTIDDFLAAQRERGHAGTAQAQRIAMLLGGLWRAAGPGTGSRPGWGWPGVDQAAAARLSVDGAHLLASRKRVLTDAELRKLWKAVRNPPPNAERGGWIVVALAMVTGLRIGALALCRESDLDLDPPPIVGALDSGPTLRVPAEDGRKMNARARREGDDLILPLSPLAVELFREALALPGRRGDAVFVGRRGQQLTSHTINVSTWAALRRQGAAPADATPHDLRRTVRSGISEIDHGGSEADEERLIGHQPPRTSATRPYDRGRRLRRLRPIADAWAERLLAIVGATPAEVTPLRQRS